MPCIEQSVQACPSPLDHALETGIDRGEDPAERRHGQAGQSTALDIRDRRLRDAGRGRELRLAEPAPLAQDP